jgi:hypothetical protein
VTDDRLTDRVSECRVSGPDRLHNVITNTLYTAASQSPELYLRLASPSLFPSPQLHSTLKTHPSKIVKKKEHRWTSYISSQVKYSVNEVRQGGTGTGKGSRLKTL